MAKQTKTNDSDGLPRLGGYELLGKVGKGGMGNVFKARQISMDRIVALKVLTSSLAKDKKFVERFRREAKAAARLSHMNIIQSIDVGEEDGYHYFAMEYVQGPTMDDLLQKTKVLKEDFCLEIICQTARAIQAAEKLGIVHFDIKPSNIMITRDRLAKLADFGLARRVEEGATRAKQALVFGTPEYMSPEQALGKPDVDSRSDIYSLGVSFYQMVTGRLPFEGKTPRETVDLRLISNPIPPAQLNPSLSNETDQIILKMLKRDRNQRYQNAGELIEDLEYMIKLRSNTVEARAAARMQIDIPPEELEAVEQIRYLPPRRRKVAGPVFGFVCLAALAGGIFYLVKNPDVVKKIQEKFKLQIGPRQPGEAQPAAHAIPEPQEPRFIPKDIAEGKGGKAPMSGSGIERRRGPTHPKAQQSYAEIMDMRRQKLAQGDYKGLLNLYKLYPENYKFAVEWKDLEEQRKKDLDMVKKKLEFMDDALGKLVAEEKIPEALALVGKIQETFPEDILQAADFDKKAKQITDYQAKYEKATKAKREAALQAYMDAAAPAHKMIREGMYDDAIKKLDELAVNPDYAAIQEVIKNDKAAIELLKPYMASLYEGGKALKGKQFKVGGIGGTVLEAGGGAIKLQMAGKAVTKSLGDLKPDELNQLAKAGGFTKNQGEGQLHLSCAIFYYFNRDMGNTSLELLKAEEEGVNIDRYRSWLK